MKMIEENRDFIDDLNSLPEQFTINMESQRSKRFHDMLPTICHEMNIVKKIDELTDEQQKDIIDIFERFFSYGYYSGVQFTLHPDEEYKPLKEIPTKNDEE